MAKNTKFYLSVSLTRPQFNVLMGVKKGQHEQSVYHCATLKRLCSKGYVLLVDKLKVNLTKEGRALLLLMFHESGMDLDAELLRCGYTEEVSG